VAEFCEHGDERFKVLKAVNMSMLFFRDGDSVSPKRRYLPASPHNVTAQNNNMDMAINGNRFVDKLL
jgi:hypothetical protein